MPALKRQLPEIIAEHCEGGIKSYAIKTIKPTDLRSCRNTRSNKKGGRFPRGGQEDSGIDLSSFAFTVGRGILSTKSPKRLWFAGDDGSSTKICYTDTDITGAQYHTVFDTGLSLQTGYYVTMKEWWGDIYYGNGYNTVGRIITGQVATGGVVAGAGTLNLKPGNTVKFAATGSGFIGTDAFSWTGKSGDTLTGCSGLLDHNADELITVNTTLSPNYEDKATVIEEWLASLNLMGDPEQPFTWEFSKFANAGTPSAFYDFSGSPSGTELVGEGGAVTAALATKNFFLVWKQDGIFGTGRTEIDISTGARIPQPIKKGVGTPNPRTVAAVGDDDVIFMTSQGRIARFGATIQNAEQTIGIDSEFDADIENEIVLVDKPGSGEWVHYNQREQVVKASVFVGGARFIYLKDFTTGQWFLDDNKNYDVVCEHDNGKTWGFDGSANKIFIDNVGNYDDTVPVNSEWLTGRLGLPAFFNGRSRYIRLHGYMTLGSIAYIDFYKNDEFQFTKTLTDDYVTRRTSGTPVGSGGVGHKSVGSGGDPPMAFPFRFPIGANHRGEDFSIKCRITGENGDFVQFDGFRIGMIPLSRFPNKHA